MVTIKDCFKTCYLAKKSVTHFFFVYQDTNVLLEKWIVYARVA